MSIFPDELIRIAATGSSPRTKATVEQSKFPLLEKWQPEDDQPERDLLVSIAAYGLQRQAGYVPEARFDNLPPKVEITENHACTITAQQHLKLMLNRVHEELLPHWIDEVHKHGQHIPYEMLPSVLDYGAKKSNHHDLLKNALGGRGQWLAQQAKNTAWEWILQEDEFQLEHESHYTAWENHFRRMRQRDPVKALDVLSQHWLGLDSLMRMALLRAMSDGLNENDANFLWTLFEEETTRFTAARWLLQIEGTEFSIQARHNISKLLSVIKEGEVEDWVVDFTWSHSFNGHPMQTRREEATELCKIMGYEFNPELMLMLLPLSYWYETYDITPEQLVMAAQNSSRPSVFYRIWTNMAIQEPDSDFLFSLVMNVERHAGLSLVNHLTQEQLIQAATHWLQKKSIFSLQHNAAALLNAIQETWSIDLAETFLDSLEQCFSRIPRPLLDTNMRQTLKQYARLLPLEVDSRFEKVLHINERGDLSEAETEQLNGIIDIVKFRAEMIEAIQDGARDDD